MLTRSQIAKASADAQVDFCLDKQPTYEVALARRIESAATAPLLARIAELEAANEEFGKRQEWWSDRMLELEQQLEEARKDAIPAMRAYAAKNPRFVSHEDVVQDPNGVHAWLEKHGTAIKEQT